MAEVDDPAGIPGIAALQRRAHEVQLVGPSPRCDRDPSARAAVLRPGQARRDQRWAVDDGLAHLTCRPFAVSPHDWRHPVGQRRIGPLTLTASRSHRRCQNSYPHPRHAAQHTLTSPLVALLANKGEVSGEGAHKFELKRR
jgi:hypothetical protein